jgi:hypothetical protein
MAELNKNKKKIMSRYKKAKTQKDKFIPGWKELDEFFNGDQYKNMNIPPWVPKPVTNFIHLVITTKRAALASENPMAQLRPLAAADVNRIEKLQTVYEWVWKRVKARNVLRDNIQTSKLMGTGIAHIYWNEMTGVLGGTDAMYEGEIGLKEIDIMNFFLDPNAYTLEEAAWVHVTEKRLIKWVEQQFDVSLTDAKGDEANYGEEYARDYYRPNEGDKEDRVIDFHAHYEKYWNTEKVKEEVPVYSDDGLEQIGTEEVETGEEVGGWNYKVTYLAGDKVVGEQDPLEPNMYPFAVLYDYKRRQEFWGLGTGSLIIENQKLINKVESIVAMIGTLLQNPQKIISKSSGINPVEAMKYSFAPGHVWVTNDRDPARSIRWQEVPQIPPALLNLAEMAKNNIREVTGLNEAYMGQNVGSLQTSGGVNSLIDRATMRDRDQMFDIEQYVEQLTRLILAFVTTKYTEERVIRLTKDPANPNEVTFEPFTGIEFADLEYDVEIDVSAHAPITQARREAELDRLMELQGQYGMQPRVITPQEYIKGKRMVDADKITKRMDREEQQNKLDMLTQVAGMMQNAMMDNVPPEQIMMMAEDMLRGLESGETPTDPNVAAMGGGGIGSAGGGSIQAQQAGM